METAAVKTMWVLDPTHSELNFRVKHLMIANVKGSFRKFNVEVDGEDFTTSAIKVSVETASVFSNDDKRDGHLQGADFFDSAAFPSMEFVSTHVDKVSEGMYHLTGMLTIKDITKEVKLEVEFAGINKDPWGNEKAVFEVNGVINRKDWNLNWNAALETGGVLVSEEVKIMADIQLAKKSA